MDCHKMVISLQLNDDFIEKRKLGCNSSNDLSDFTATKLQ